MTGHFFYHNIEHLKHAFVPSAKSTLFFGNDNTTIRNKINADKIVSKHDFQR